MMEEFLMTQTGVVRSPAMVSQCPTVGSVIHQNKKITRSSN
jgi:hypothetical protein